jgi:AcrR family transcriptional regulator
VSDNHLFGPRTLAVRQFLEAIQRLTIEQWKEVIAAWRATVTDAWHDADSAVAAAVAANDRRQAREELLSELGDITRRIRWNGGETTGTSAQATESTAHYVASLAALALLVRDRIARQYFDALYHPFMGVIPLATINGVH